MSSLLDHRITLEILYVHVKSMPYYQQHVQINQLRRFELVVVGMQEYVPHRVDAEAELERK